MTYHQKLDEYKCSKCEAVKLVSEFYKDNNCALGRKSACKRCVGLYHSKWYERNKSDKDQKNEEYRKSHWQKIKEQTYTRYDSQKHRARMAVNNAVVKGKFKKTDCGRCGSVETEFHHINGYDKENYFVGMWLCRPCHAQLHKELRWKTA